MKILSAILLLLCFTLCRVCHAQTALFEDNFDSELSEIWQPMGLEKEDYRIREGALEIRIKPEVTGQPRPVLKVDLPFSTRDNVVVSVDVAEVDGPLDRGQLAGVSLLHNTRPLFSARKTNIDGLYLFAPGEVEFIGQSGQEGDVNKYTVKYWPADKAAGPLRIIVHGNYAYFQVGPNADGKYMNFFHSAISESSAGLGFGLFAVGPSNDKERWVRFDNFTVIKHE